jgi:hypothetical protein
VPQQAVQDALVLRLDDGIVVAGEYQGRLPDQWCEGKCREGTARSWKMYPGQLGGWLERRATSAWTSAGSCRNLPPNVSGAIAAR